MIEKIKRFFTIVFLNIRDLVLATLFFVLLGGGIYGARQVVHSLEEREQRIEAMLKMLNVDDIRRELQAVRETTAQNREDILEHRNDFRELRGETVDGLREIRMGLK